MSEEADALIKRYRQVTNALEILCTALGGKYGFGWIPDPEPGVIAILFFLTPDSGERAAAEMIFCQEKQGIKFVRGKNASPVDITPDAVAETILGFWRDELSQLLQTYTRGIGGIDPLIIAAAKLK